MLSRAAAAAAVAAAATAAAALPACGDDLVDPDGALRVVSGPTPFADGCDGVAAVGTVYPGLEVEPWLAADPAAPRHLVAAWQQDRWSSGGARGTRSAVSTDGGATWIAGGAAFSRCGGAPAGGPGDYDRATDPWVSIGPDGVVWQIALAFDAASARNAVLAATSRDGGLTWDPPAVLRADDDPDVFNDKDAITADPVEPGRAYAVWDRLTGQTMPTKPVGTGPTMLARATAGAWEPARAIYDPGVDNQTIGNTVVVLPDGAVVDVFQRIEGMSTPTPRSTAAVIRSTDHGATWSDAIAIAPMIQTGIADAAGAFIRTGAMPAIAVDPASGALYVAWEDASPSGGAREGVVVAASHDGGLTWSAPAAANPPGAAAWGPALAVGAGGEVALTYYDLRGGDPTRAGVGGAPFVVTAHLARSGDGGATWRDEPLTAPFDLGPARVGDVYFVGDYQALVATDGAYVPLFVRAAAVAGDPTDVMVRPLPATPR